MAAIVQFDNVGLRYGTGAEVLSGITLSLAAGGLHILAGSSGTGKTSFLNLVTLAARPSRGIVRLFGEDAAMLPRARLPGLRRRLGIVRQQARLVPSLTARENIALPLRIAALPAREIHERTNELLDWAGLTQRAEARPEALSDSERQRVAIARAVIGHPDLIVADEPTGPVDNETATRILHLFEQLNAHGVTILLATHDPQIAARLPMASLLQLAHKQIVPLARAVPGHAA
jgi:cell division transport system ATP-binding protein